MMGVRLPTWGLSASMQRRPAADHYGWHCWLHIGPLLVMFWRVDFSDEIEKGAA